MSFDRSSYVIERPFIEALKPQSWKSDPASCERQPFDLEGKAAEQVFGAILLAEGVVHPLQYGLANTPPQFLQGLEYTQCDGVPVRVAGGAQE